MSNRKIRWSKVYESSEEELVDFLRERKLAAQRTTAEESSETMQQIAEHTFTLWCAEGSLVLRQNAMRVSLQPGDAVSVHANTPYDLLAGLTGYVCYITQ